MEYENLIYDFVDGKLDSSQEQEFFLAMATNEELRSELRQTMALESAFSKDAAMLKPPTRSTVALFSSLGLPVPSGVGSHGINNAAGANTPAAAKSTILGKFSQALFSTILTGAAAVAVYFFLVKPDIDLLELRYSSAMAEKDTLSRQLQEKTIELNRLPQSVNTPVISSREVVPQVNRPMAKTLRSSVNNVPSGSYIIHESERKEANESQTDLANENTNTTSNNEDIELALERVQMPDNKLQYGNGILANNIKSIEPIYLTNTVSSSSKIGLSVEFKGFGEQPDGNPRTDQIRNTMFNNMGITVLKSLPFIADNLYIGVDIRQESFYQTWEGIKPVDGLKYRFSQYPNFLTGGAAIRYVFLDTKHFDAFTQAYGGLSYAGFLGRGLIGFRVSYNDDFYFIMGFEASQMWYNGSGKDFTAAKYGINYGIGFNY